MKELIHLTDFTNLPLSSNQKGLWIISQQDKFNPAYNILLTYHLEGKINVDIFRKSMELLFDRQHTMFSVFKQKDGVPFLNITPQQVIVELIDFSGMPVQSRRDEILSFAGENSRKCFDIETGPLYRLFLLKEDENSYFFNATIHHLIFDGFSHRVFVQELSRIYSNLIRGVNETLEPLRFHSYDYAEFEKEALSPEYEKELVYFWKENLKECQPDLKFPYDHPRNNEPTGFGFREPFEISGECTQKLRGLSMEADSSLFHILLSALGVLLQKYTGENDICIGVPVSDRLSYPSFKIFGMFVNTVAVRLNIERRNKFSEHINYTTELVKKAILHSKLPFERIVEVINPERVPGINPFFQISLSWVNNLTIPMNLGGISGKLTMVNQGVSPLDITFNIWENGSVIEGYIEYNIDILKRDTIIRLRDNFVHLLQTIVENPDQNISDILIISENDKKKLSEFNNTEVAITDCLIQNFFENQAVLTPSKTAVISGNSSLTYKELNDQSNQLARHLISLGITNGDIVGICMDRSVEMVISVLGVLKAGCCYLPMDPSFPDVRINYMYEDSGAKVLISQSSLKEKFRQFPSTSIVLTDTDKSKISKYNTKKPDLNINTQGLAYIIYTSGSTGKPKGVKVHHQAVVNFINSMSRRPGFSKEERLLAVTTLSFDISVLELFLPLSFGAELIIAETEDIFEGQKLSGLLDLNDITVMQATPAIWNILLSSGWNGKKNLKALCGGEAILPGLVKDLLPKVESLWDMYGPTETTVWSTCNQLTDSAPPILVGTPIDNTTVYILDKDNNQLPIGVIGEICIGGLGVTKGYHNRPELTAEKFIPFENSQIIYKTGDLGRYLIDGNIEIFGRIDNQIKLRGFRIEPGEIENLLSQLSGVKEAVVKVHKFDENDERLVAFLNVDPEFKLTKEEIIGSLSQHLPAYMIPSFFQRSDGFPRLPNGKINKKAILFAIDESEKKHEKDFDSLTATEKKLINIWETILKIKNINPSGNFFDSGGTSILAINLANLISKEFNITLKALMIFEFPTIKDQSEYLSGKKGDRFSLKNIEIDEKIKSKKNVNFKKYR